jgi:hypothetical protein
MRRQFVSTAIIMFWSMSPLPVRSTQLNTTVPVQPDIAPGNGVAKATGRLYTNPCGWSTTFDVDHPERPPRLILATSQSTCAAPVKTIPIVQTAAEISMTYRTSDAWASISAIALEAGSVGDVIRCRSSIDGSIVHGRIVDSRSVEMLIENRMKSW